MHPTRRVNFHQFIERQHAEGDVEIEMPDGVIVIPAAILWPSVTEALEAGETSEAMRLILGDEQCERFVAQGGSFKLLSAIYGEAQGVSPGEAPASPNS